MLDLEDVVTFLLDRALLTAAAVVDGELRVSDVSGRNRVYLVTRADGSGIVLKAAVEEERPRLAVEARMLERLRATGLAARLPRVLAYDHTRGILVLEALPHARALDDVHRTGEFPAPPTREAARALAAVHSRAADALDGLGVDAREPPVLRLHEPDWDYVRDASPVQVELLSRLQEAPDLRAGLAGLRADWRRDAVVHGDIRWSNLLVRDRPGGGPAEVQLIDWETAMRGDPALDMGAFLAEYLARWLYSTPTTDSPPVRLLPQLSAIPLADVQRSIRDFWTAYACERGASEAALSPALRRATRFAAARLIELALERAEQQAERDGFEHHLLDVSAAIFAAPDEMTVRLLGINAPWRRT